MPRRVLIVEDDASHLNFMAEVMRGLGFNASCAASAEEAFTNIDSAESGFDLALLDMQLPGEDGVAVLKRVRAKFPTAKVIVITSFPEEYAKACEKGEVDGYLRKPAGIVELTQRVAEIFKTEESTLVKPSDIIKPLDRHGHVASARILFLNGPWEAKFIRGIIPTVETDEFIGKPYYGLYEVQEVYDLASARTILKTGKTDIFIATSHVYWDSSLTGGMLTPTGFIMEVLHSNYCPKEILFLACYEEDHGKEQLDEMQKKGLSPLSTYQLPDFHSPEVVSSDDRYYLKGNALKIAAAIEATCFRYGLTLPLEEGRRLFKQRKTTPIC